MTSALLDFAVLSHGSAAFNFIGNLRNLLIRKYRKEPVTYHFKENPAIKDPIEAMGIPHTEVDIILANGRSVGFSYRLQHTDNISVYPVFSPYKSTEDTIHLSFHPGFPVTFILDIHLGKLARRLRLLGFDCLYRNDLDDAEIMQESYLSHRIILTRDLGILKHRNVNRGYLVRSGDVDKQVMEVVCRFQLFPHIQPFLRCMACNGLMKPVRKSEIMDRLEPKTRLYYSDFHACNECGRLYWKGAHYAKIEQWLNSFMKTSPSFPTAEI